MKKKKSAEIEAGKTQAAPFFQNKDLTNQISSHLQTSTSQNPPLFQGHLPQSLLLQPHIQPSQTLSISQSAPLESLTAHSQSTPSESLSQPQSPQPSRNLSFAQLQRPPPSQSRPTLQQHSTQSLHSELRSSTLENASSQLQRLPRQILSSKSSPFQLQNPPLRSMAESPDLPGVSLESCPPHASKSTPAPNAVTTLGETGSLIRSTMDECDSIIDEMEMSQNLDESSYFSEEAVVEEPNSKETKVPCEHCSELVKELRAEIVALKKRQLPVPSSAQSIAFLQDILKAYARVGEVGEEIDGVSDHETKVDETKFNSVSQCDSYHESSNALYKAAPGEQELVPGSGIHISSARLHSIHSQCGTDPKKLFLLLIEAFFSEETLARSLAHGSRAQTSKGPLAKALNQDVVKTVKAYSGRFATLNKVELSVATMNRMLTKLELRGGKSLRNCR